MGFDLRHVMGNVVNLVQAVIRHLTGQGLFEAASNKTDQYLTVGKRVISRPAQSRQIVLTFRTGERCANQLPVRQVKTILMNRFLKAFDIVAAYLVAEPA